MSKFTYSPGRVKIEDVFINKSSSQNTMDVTPMVSEINIESSLVDTTTVITLSINDDIGFLTEFQIESGDTVEMNIAWSSKPVNLKCYVLRIENIVNGESGRVYNVTCVSEFFYESMKTKISKSVSGKPSDIAKDIFIEYSFENTVWWEESNNTQKLVIPYKAPVDIMRMLAKRSLSSVDNTYMFFWQDSKMNYNFASLEFLIKSREGQDLQRFIYNASTYNLNTKGAARNIEELTYGNISDLPLHVKNYSASSTSVATDLNSKYTYITTNNYWRDFDNGPRLNKNALHADPELDLNSNRTHEAFLDLTQGSNILNTFNDNTDLKKTMFDASHYIDIVINSNEQVDVGNVVEIVIPKPAPRSDGDGEDEYWTGKYLVYAKREVLSNDNGKIALTLIKDSKE